MAAQLTAQLAGLSLNRRPGFAQFTGLRGQSCSCSRVAAPANQQVSRRPLRVQAARIGGVEVPNQKFVEYSLQYIYGIGPTTARSIISATGVGEKRTKDLSEEELTRLRDEVDKYTTEGDLRRFNNLAIKRLKDIGCYRGRRHILGLPVRGQGTKNNARTRKGRAKTVAGKKKAPK